MLATLAITLIESSKLPDDEKLVKKLVLEQDQYKIIDGILNHESPTNPGHWRIVVPECLQSKVVEEAHSERFAGHFTERRIYNTLKKAYWWKGMRSAGWKQVRSCLTCATKKGTGRATRPPLQPIAVGGPFHRVGVDVLQLPLTQSCNQYMVIFMDYLTKWVEAFAVANQNATPIAQLLVEKVFCRHGAPEELSSDRGSNFLAEVVMEVCRLLKVNNLGYHPQTNGLIEKFNCTLSYMMAKSAHQNGSHWDQHLLFLLFAYRATVQETTHESPFYLLYGRAPRLHSDSVLHHVKSLYIVHPDGYRTALTIGPSEAWSMAQEELRRSRTCTTTSTLKNLITNLVTELWCTCL